MRIIPKPPVEHELLNPIMRQRADNIWWALHFSAYTIIAGAVGVVIAVSILALK